MVPNDALINVLRRKLRFTFKDQTQRVDIYKQRGSTKRAMIKRASEHSPEYAAKILQQAGMSGEDIERFLAEVRA